MGDCNRLLAELAAEREARSATLEGQTLSPAAGAAAAPPAAAAAAAAVSGRPEGRSRKKNPPVRRPQAGEREAQEEPLEAAGAAPARDPAKRPPAADERAGAQRPKKKPAPSKPSAPTSLEFAGGEGFDPADVAGAFMRNDFGEGRGSLGTLAFDQFASAARIHACESTQVSHIL
jgi:hypothetical protein